MLFFCRHVLLSCFLISFLQLSAPTVCSFFVMILWRIQSFAHTQHLFYWWPLPLLSSQMIKTCVWKIQIQIVITYDCIFFYWSKKCCYYCWHLMWKINNSNPFRSITDRHICHHLFVTKFLLRVWQPPTWQISPFWVWCRNWLRKSLWLFCFKRGHKKYIHIHNKMV